MFQRRILPALGVLAALVGLAVAQVAFARNAQLANDAHPQPRLAATQPATNASVITATVPILMYHHVGNPNTYQTYSVDTAMFDWQMGYLQSQGYAPVSLDQIVAALNGGPPLPPKPIAITFDDGWQNQYDNALPILLKHGMQATFYLIVNPLDHRKANMTWDEASTLVKDGMWIGSHTLNHPNLPRLSVARLSREVIDSKRMLQDKLGVTVTVTTFAYPGGAFNPRVEAAVAKAGYTSATTVIKGYAQRADQIYRLQRVGVYGIDTQARFIAKVDGTFFHRSWPTTRSQAKLPDPDSEPDPGANP